MNKHRLIVIIFCTLFVLSTPLFSMDIPRDITFMGLDLIASDVNKIVFAVQDEGETDIKSGNKTYKNIGTGFLMVKDNVVIGITCEHVVRTLIANNRKIIIGLDTGIGYQRVHAVVGMIDTNNDIAIVIPTKPENLNVELKNITLDKSFLGNKTNIKEGRGVLIPGYPLGLGLEYDENHPITKFGIVAQYTGRDYMLLYATANPGNSGSPVFELKDRKIIGMIQSYSSDYIDLYDKNGILAAKIPYNSGLSRAINSELILQVIDKLSIK